MRTAGFYNPQLRPRILAGALPHWLKRHPRSTYIVNAIRATPVWADRGELSKLYERARELTRITKTRHVCDHIIPLTHPYVCGLHVASNLRVVPWRVNAVKSNRWSPDQLELPL